MTGLPIQHPTQASQAEGKKARADAVTQPQHMILVDELARQIFAGYEHADAERLRSMIQYFNSRSTQVSAQQRRAAEEVMSTARTMGQATRRLEQMHEEVIAAEEHSAQLKTELAAAEMALSRERTANSALTRSAEDRASGSPDTLAAMAACVSGPASSGDEVVRAASTHDQRQGLVSGQKKNMFPSATSSSAKPFQPQPRYPSVAESDVTIVEEERAEGLSGSTASSRKPIIPGSAAQGLRYLLGARRQDSNQQDFPQQEQAADIVIATSAQRSACELHQRSVGSENRLSDSLRSSMSTSEDLIDRLYDQCIEHCGGQIFGLASVRRVLLDVIGEASDEQLLVELFRDSDVDTNGQISQREVVKACRNQPHLAALLGFDICSHTLGGTHNLFEALLQKMSLDGDRKVTFDEFVETCVNLLATADTRNEVLRPQFKVLVNDLLSLRNSREVQLYEQRCSTLKDVCRTLNGAENSSLPSEMQRAEADSTIDEHSRDPAQTLRSWVSLPSWSLDLSRFSLEPGACLDGTGNLSASRSDGTASNHWHTVSILLDKLRDACVLRADCTSTAILHELRYEIATFVRCFSDEARARLRTAQTSSGRLLEQRRRSIDDLTAQLEARDAEFQLLVKERDRLRTEWESVCAERDHISRRNSRKVVELVKANGPESSQDVAALEALVDTLSAQVAKVEKERDIAEAGRFEAEHKLELLSSPSSQHTVLRGVAIASDHQSDFQETSLGDNSLAISDVTSSVLRRALEAEKVLRQELQELRTEFEQRTEHDVNICPDEDSLVATNAAAVQDRLSEMHGGTWFEKVAFRWQRRQLRVVRLSFDMRRIEWGQHERGPFKAVPVEAILRVDYADASRAYQTHEFNGQLGARPSPGLCLSITTPSRSLDLVAHSERDVEVWVLGLNEVIPYRPERQRLTTQDFLLRRAILRLEEGASDVGASTAVGRAESEGSSSGTASSKMGIARTIRQLLPVGRARHASNGP